MTHHEATAILNRVREGQQFSLFVITRALELTGDYEANGSIGMDQTIQKESVRGRWGGSPILVATDPSGHCQETRTECR
jgi:ApbE superfamily uncharacterized protein (UPF0280 family)